jgi:hypothetical protein
MPPRTGGWRLRLRTLEGLSVKLAAFQNLSRLNVGVHGTLPACQGILERQFAWVNRKRRSLLAPIGRSRAQASWRLIA